MRLASAIRRCSVRQKVETSEKQNSTVDTDTSDDDEAFFNSDVERRPLSTNENADSAKETVVSTNDLPASTGQCRQHRVESKSAESSPLVRKRFVLKKSK